MRYICGIVLILLITVNSGWITRAQEPTQPTPPPIERPAPASTLMQDGITLERYFGALPQGTVGLLGLTGEGIIAAQASLRGRIYPFQQTPDDGWYAFLVADVDAQPRDYPFSVLVQHSAGTTNFEMLVTIESAGFIRQNFEVPATIGYLIIPEVERNEFARLDAIIGTISPTRAWDETRWQLPIPTAYSSAFGQLRILNQTIQTRHTGWDQTAPVGTPVAAMATGTVAFAGQLDIRGNYVLIDHGWGVYSGYAHLSQLNVARGQTVEKGQIIGSSGNTGRSNGPHLHWEIAINGEWIDGAAFIEMWLPS